MCRIFLRLKRWIGRSKGTDLAKGFLIHIVKMFSRKIISISPWSAVYRSNYFTTSVTLNLASLFSHFIDFDVHPKFQIHFFSSFQHSPVCSVPFWASVCWTRHDNPYVFWPTPSRNGLLPPFAAQDCFHLIGSWLVFTMPSLLCSHALQINLVFPIMYLQILFF